MSGTFQGRVAFCTIAVDAAGGSASIVSQSGDFDATPASPIYNAAGVYDLEYSSGSGIDANEGTFLVTLGEGCTIGGTTPIVFSATDTGLQIRVRSGVGDVDPTAATGRIHLAILCKPAN